MKGKYLLLPASLSILMFTACGGGGGEITDLRELSKDSQYILASNILDQTYNNASGVKERLVFIQSLEANMPNMLNINLKVLEMITKENIYGTMQMHSEPCPNGGKMERNINPNQSGDGGSYRFELNNCQMGMGGPTMDCIISGSWKGPQNAPNSAEVTYSDGCTIRYCNNDTGMCVIMKKEGKMTWSFNIDKIGNKCKDSNYGIDASTNVDGGPLSVINENNNNKYSVWFQDLSMDVDAYCSNMDRISFSVNGGITYEDNFCVKDRISVDIKTDSVFYEDDSANTCGGRISLNNGQVVIEASWDNTNMYCNIQIIGTDGKPINPHDVKMCKF